VSEFSAGLRKGKKRRRKKFQNSEAREKKVRFSGEGDGRGVCIRFSDAAEGREDQAWEMKDNARDPHRNKSGNQNSLLQGRSLEKKGRRTISKEKGASRAADRRCKLKLGHGYFAKGGRWGAIALPKKKTSGGKKEQGGGRSLCGGNLARNSKKRQKTEGEENRRFMARIEKRGEEHRREERVGNVGSWQDGEKKKKHKAQQKGGQK